MVRHQTEQFWKALQLGREPNLGCDTILAMLLKPSVTRRYLRVTVLGLIAGAACLFPILEAADGYGSLYQWAQQLNAEFGLNVSADGAGNCYVLGRRMGDTFFVARYDTSGLLQWIRYLPYARDSFQRFTSMVGDSSGNYFVMGQYPALVAKFNSDGVLQWWREVTPSTIGAAMAIDGQGNSYVTGAIETRCAAFIAKNNMAGDQVWFRQVVCTKDQFGTGSAGGGGIGADESGNVYLVGTFSGNVDFGSTNLTVGWGGFFAKYDAAGQLEWARVIGSGAREVGIDAGGSVYVSTDEAGHGGQVTKYRSDGVMEWAVAGSKSLALDREGNVYTQVKNSYPSKLQKYDSNGVPVWYHQAGAEFQGLALDPAGNLYATGESSADEYNQDTGFIVLKRAAKVPPIIVAQPQGRTVIAGNEATFGVNASEPGPVSFQWQKNGTNLVGQTNALMVINSASPSDAGDYSVVLTNADGIATSDVAVLIVLEDTAPRLGAFAYTNGQFVFYVSGAANRPCRIEAADALDAAVNWTPVFTNIVPFWYSDSGVGIGARRFYRAAATTE